MIHLTENFNITLFSAFFDIILLYCHVYRRVYKLVLDTYTGTSLVEVYYWGIACAIPEAHIPIGSPPNALGSSVLHNTSETLSLYLALDAGIPDVELNRVLGLWGLGSIPTEAHIAKADFIDGVFSGATYYTWEKS